MMGTGHKSHIFLLDCLNNYLFVVCLFISACDAVLQWWFLQRRRC